MSTLEEIRTDLAAYADDDEQVAVDPDGQALLVRGGQEWEFRLILESDGSVSVQLEGETIPYRTFLVRRLARLDVLAERLIAKRGPVDSYVMSDADLESASAGRQRGGAVDLLHAECQTPPPFAARVVFITADAGLGKTALLREYQHLKANEFLDGNSEFVFWHVDLQGRQLLRLSEALMGDLADLRVGGLWMPAVTSLIRLRALVVAVDGFDELAAEQGQTDALGALALLVRQMRGSGVIVAAARRAFFDTEDYVRRSGMFRRAVAEPCEFDQLSLRPWSRNQAVEYLTAVRFDGTGFSAPEDTYAQLLSSLGGDDEHPMLTRPFLLTHIARALLLYGGTPSDFVQSMTDPMKGVGEVVRAFVKREVSDKWIYKDTGEPYLTEEQHMLLLGAVAEEMYVSQKDFLDLDVIDTIATLLLDEWMIEASRRQQILEMVHMHVLLTQGPTGRAGARGFDHPEFRDYFLAYNLQRYLRSLVDGEGLTDLVQLLGVAQLSDATARYVANLLDLSGAEAAKLAQRLGDAGRKEWKPTFLQPNLGTLLAYVLTGHEFKPPLRVESPVLFTSLVFERSRIENVTFADATFVNASLAGAQWENVRFQDCHLGELSFDSDGRFSNVVLERSHIDGIRLVSPDGNEPRREYSPTRIRRLLESMGFVFKEEAPAAANEPEPTSRVYAFTHRLLRTFYRTTIIREDFLGMRFPQDQQFVLREVIPRMEKHGILEPRTWRGPGHQKIWTVRRLPDDVLAAEESGEESELARFWAEVRAA